MVLGDGARRRLDNSAKSTGVTWFTIASVHCAERMVATTSSHGVR